MLERSIGVNRKLWVLIGLVLFGSSQLFGQADAPQAPRPNVPQVTFELTWRANDPQWYQVAIDSIGRASYQSQPHTNAGETPGDPFVIKFTATEKMRKQVFDGAKELNYFQGDFTYQGNQRMADTGDKVLSYTAEGKTTKTSYNWTP